MSSVTLCLDPALSMQRRGLNSRAIAAELQRIGEACAQPLLCPQRDIGCREVNARYLRDVVQRRKARGVGNV